MRQTRMAAVPVTEVYSVTANARMFRAVTAYCDLMRNKNLTDGYVSMATRTLRCFATWCEIEGVAAPTKVTGRHLSGYMATLRDMGGSSQRGQWGIIRSFLQWTGNKAVSEYRYRARGPDRFKVRWLTPDQVNLLIDAPLKPPERLLVSFGLYAGLRMREVLDMRVIEAETALQTGWLVVRGKGYKSRPIYLHPALRAAIADYLRAEDLLPAARLAPLTPAKYDATLRAVGKELGFVLSSHDLRRTHAAKLCEDGGLDVACLSLGHADPSMTLRYAGAQRTRLREAICHLDYSADNSGSPLAHGD